MKNILITILKEIGIFIVILVVLAAVIAFVFKDQLPYDEVIPSGDKYVKANLKTYSVTSTDRISEIEAIKITHETNQGQIVSAENEVRIQTGKYTPFGSIDGTTDLPSERVGVSMVITSGDSRNNSSSETLEYPTTDNDMVRQMEIDQSESNESAAARRMGNVE